MWCTDPLVPVEETPANVTARCIAKLVTTAIGELAENPVPGDEDGLTEGGHQELPHASFVRVGELHFQPVLDLKKRVCFLPLMHPAARSGCSQTVDESLTSAIADQ